MNQESSKMQEKEDIKKKNLKIMARNANTKANGEKTYKKAIRGKNTREAGINMMKKQ